VSSYIARLNWPARMAFSNEDKNMSKKIVITFVAIMTILLGTTSFADPILTFADPGTQCFTFTADTDPGTDGGWLVGGNDDISVEVLAGAFAGTTFADASFTLTDLTGNPLEVEYVTYFGDDPIELELEAGRLEIWDDAGSQLLLAATFDFALLYPGNVGASDVLACNVTFSGLLTQGMTNLDDEQFSFAFASMDPADPFGYEDMPDWTSTASFASGADFTMVPEPGTLMMAISGTLAFVVTLARKRLR